MAGFTEIRCKNETMPNYVIFWMSRKVVKSRWFFLSFWCYYVHRCKKKSEIAFSKFEGAYYYRIYCNIEGGAVCKKYLTISTKSPILDVRLGSEYTCDLCLFLSKISTSWNNVLVRNIWSAIFALMLKAVLALPTYSTSLTFIPSKKVDTHFRSSSHGKCKFLFALVTSNRRCRYHNIVCFSENKIHVSLNWSVCRLLKGTMHN